MRDEINIDRLPKKTINNLVLVETEDIFNGFTTNGGIKLVNLTDKESWGDSKEFNISEFVMRYGKVVIAPETVTKGSFNYETEVEIKKGDIVFWNLISFANHIPLKYNDKLYLLVDYHEIIARERDGGLMPVNGFGLFSPVQKTEKALEYSVTSHISDEWVLETLPEKHVRYDDPDKKASGIWEQGDKVRLFVRQSPFKLEGTIRNKLEKELYACQMNFIICTC